MRTIYNYSNLFILLIISQLAFANTNKEVVDEGREVKASYQVNEGDRLRLSNKYGEIHIETWDKNEVSVVISIKAWGKNDAVAKENLNRVEVRHEKSGNEIVFLTEVESRKHSSRNRKSGFEINYRISMPKSLKLELKNKFGDVYIAEHAADLYINVKHGELRAGKMISDKQEIEVSFGEVDIEELGSGQLDVKHGQCSIDKAKNLNVDMQFGAFSIKEVEKLDIDIKHGGLEIDKVSELRAEAGFGSVEIEEVSKSANIEVRHGSCQIDELKKGFTKVDVNASFGSVTIGLQDDLSGDFDIETSFGGFSYRQGNNIHLQREIKKSNSGSFSGIIGGGKGGKIYITTEHGSAEFK